MTLRQQLQADVDAEAVPGAAASSGVVVGPSGAARDENRASAYMPLAKPVNDGSLTCVSYGYLASPEVYQKATLAAQRVDKMP